MKAQFTMLAAYNEWVNRRLYGAAAALPEHRFTGEGAEPAELDAILCDDFDELRAAREAEDTRIIAYVDGLSEAALAGTIRYRTTRNPTAIEQYLAPLLTHFFNHQTHHRGQAHCLLTALTGEAPSFDLLVFQRQTGIAIVSGQGGDFSRPERRASR